MTWTGNSIGWRALALMALALATGIPAAAEGFRPSVAVLPLQNLSPYGGRLLGRRAADQLALDLGTTGRWRVLDRLQTDRACAQRELAPPYVIAYQQEVAHALGADLIFTGTVHSVEVDAGAGRARVMVLVKAIDQVSGQSVLSVSQTGEAGRGSASAEATDLLVTRALAAAMAQVSSGFAAATPRQGEVTDPRDGKTITVRFAEGGPALVMQRLLVYRVVTEGEATVPGKLLAAAVVTRVSGDNCEARVLARGGEIKSGDIVVTVGESRGPGTGARWGDEIR